VAFRAARALQEETSLSAEERWLVGKALYRHALYSEARSIFERLYGVADRAVPSWQVAFLAGRCDFRQERWDEAIAWYRKAHARRRSAEGRAEILVHIARSYELSDRLEEAVEAARQAMATRTTDDRRLFLARLRLRLDQPDKAAAGLAKIRGRSRRARGEILVALYDLRAGRQQAARVRLGGIPRGSWSAPAAVIAAGISFDAGDPGAAMELLDREAISMAPFWSDRARALMDRFPVEIVDAWRTGCAEEAGSPDQRLRRRALARWAQLEIDREQLEMLRSVVAREVGVDRPLEVPVFPPGLAGDLWSVGLTTEAVRWDPGGMPNGDVSQAIWTAQRFIERQTPWQAIPTADAAWRMAGSDIPTRGYPLVLQEALHPLPDPDLVWRSAVRNQVPWAALSGVAREESRWNPTVVSRVGARGLMQLMPSTAVAVADTNRWPIPDLDDLFDPQISLDLGGSEISRLLSVFEGQLAPAVAAYNAGESQSKIWLDQCGTPCRPEVFVGNITFSATSTYTQDVLAAADVYVNLYGAVPRAVSARAVGSGSGVGRGRAASSGR